jgi:hypothetical protein
VATFARAQTALALAMKAASSRDDADDAGIEAVVRLVAVEFDEPPHPATLAASRKTPDTSKRPPARKLMFHPQPLRAGQADGTPARLWKLTGYWAIGSTARLDEARGNVPRSVYVRRATEVWVWTEGHEVWDWRTRAAIKSRFGVEVDRPGMTTRELLERKRRRRETDDRR